MSLKIVILGLSITSSWGNGHASTYRGLVRELVARGHEVIFLERDVPWYAENRDLPESPYGQIGLYRNLKQLQTQFGKKIIEADLVIVGSYVPDGIFVGEWVTKNATGTTAFYDIDTPVTLAKLKRGECDYLSRKLISAYQIYLSFTGGPTLKLLETKYGSTMARPLYCSVDQELYYPESRKKKWMLGYLGTYSSDRQPALESLLLEVARQLPDQRFVVAGPQYPENILWPENVDRIEHLAPSQHRRFYNQQKFTLNLTRVDMKKAGFSPSVRLFEAAACGTPIISDYWKGLDSFFELKTEILVARCAKDVLKFFQEISTAERKSISKRALSRVLTVHTAAHRAAELESYALKLLPQTKSSQVPFVSKHKRDFRFKKIFKTIYEQQI